MQRAKPVTDWLDEIMKITFEQSVHASKAAHADAPLPRFLASLLHCFLMEKVRLLDELTPEKKYGVVRGNDTTEDLPANDDERFRYVLHLGLGRSESSEV